MPTNIDTTHVIRLFPKDDLKRSIQKFVEDKKINAGWMVTCVGSLTQFAVRFANEKKATITKGYFEIINLTGTLSIKGSHLHISIADNTGQMTGGHLMEGCIIYTTAEIVLTESAQFIFSRKTDSSTGWKELSVAEKK